MYCYECGSLILNQAIKCPYCEADMIAARNIALDNVFESIKSCCEEKQEYKVFKFGENEIILTKDTFGKRVSFTYFERIFDATWKEIEQWVQTCSFDQMVEECRDIQWRINDIIYWDVAAYWKAVGETTLDIAEKDCSYIYEDRYLCEVIQTSCEAFKELKEYADSFNDRDSVVYTNPWHGAGRTVKDALKSSLKAEALNLAGNLITDFSNHVKRQKHEKENAREIEIIKKAVKEHPEFIKNLKEAWAEHIAKIANCATFGLRRKDIGFGSWEYINIFEGIDNYWDTEVALKKINENPYDIGAYLSIYRFDLSSCKVLLELADECGIREQVQQYFAGAVDIYRIENIEAENIGFGTPITKLKEYKCCLDRMERYNTVYSRENDTVIMHRERVLAEKVAKTLASNSIAQLQDKYEEIVKKDTIANVFNAARQENIEYGREVVFHVYLKLLQNYKSRGKTGELSNLMQNLENAYKEGCFEAGDVLAKYERENSSTVEEKVKALNRTFILALHGQPHSMSYVGIWYMENAEQANIENLKKGLEYILKSLEMNSTSAMVYIGKLIYIVQKFKNGNLLKKYFTESENDMAKFYLYVADLLGEKEAASVLKTYEKR